MCSALDDAQFIFDISHQSYAHKILTGRYEGFKNKDKFHTVSGYSNPDESTYDTFHLGHASTSLSLACGLMIGRDLQHKNASNYYVNWRRSSLRRRSL